MNGCPTMCCDVMYAVMEVFMLINAVYIVKSVVPLFQRQTQHVFIWH